MNESWNNDERDTPKRTRDEFDDFAINEQSDTGGKRQCVEPPYIAQELSAPELQPFTSSLMQVDRFADSEVVPQLGDIFGGFQDEQPIGSSKPMDIFDLDNDETKELFPAKTPKDFHIEQLYPTLDSRRNYLGVQDDAISTPEVSLGNEVLSPQSLPNKRYDTCFGMIVTSASCHGLFKEDGDFISVNLNILGDILKLHSCTSNQNVGILSSPPLGRLAREFTIEFSARCMNPKDCKDRRQSLGYKDTLVQIVIYGLYENMDAVGSILADNGLYLQDPTQADTSVPYENPQFLVAPGFEMPKLEDPDTEPEPSSTLTTPEALEAPLQKSWAAEVFQTFDTIDGPVTFAPVEPSRRLRTKLKDHQIKALAMMTEKERGVLEDADFPSLWGILYDSNGNVRYRHTITGMMKYTRPLPVAGGILADEMGLGKTLSVLALIAWYLDSLSLSAAEASATLIVTTASTISEWRQQISRHFKPRQIRATVYHGSNRHRQSFQLRANDIVITTYGTLRHEWSCGLGNTVLFSDSEAWTRVILDEAHHIRNRSSKTFQAVCELRARYRWCLTGTPIHNRLDDYAALLSFIRVPPFAGQSGKSSFEEWVSGPIRCSIRHSQGLQRLRKLVAATSLRRTKDQVKGQLKLPLRIEKEQSIELDPAERSLYDFFKSRASSLVVGNFTHESEVDEASWPNILSLINLLRLICIHGEQLLPSTELELWNSQSASTIDLRHDDDNPEGREVLPIDHTLRSSLTPMPPTEVTGAYYRPSSKVNALVRNVQNEQRGNHSLLEETPVKSVIFSFWTKMLDLLEVALRANNFVFQRIDGQTSLNNRSAALKRLREDPSCTVMLASIGSIAEGVDLTAASCVHLIEPQWNPMVEAQALNRVHRIGQVREVTITRYIVKESIEGYVQKVQGTKLKLAHQSFNGDALDQLSLLEKWEIVQMLA